MDLKYRKAIANGVLSNDAMQKLKIQNMSTNPGGALNFAGGLEPKLTTSASGLGSLGSGGTGSLAEKDPTKFFGLDGTSEVAKSGGVGTFLKNNAGGIANAAMSALNFASTIGGLSKNTMSSDEMMGSGGTTQLSANGIGYTELRVDDAGILKQIDATASAATMTGALSGAALGGSIGTIFGPLGTGIGTLAGGLLGGVAGFFGGKSAKREAERLKEIAINRTHAMNALNRETAYTIGLRNEFNRENKTGINQSLFHAAEGKEGAVNPITMETYKKHIVNTAYGKTKAPLNAWVSKGEVIRSKDGSLYKVKTGSNDTARAYLQDGDSVYSKKIINPETGNPVAEDAPVYAAMGMLDRLDMNLNVGRMMLYAGKRKESNVLPGYLGGTRNFTDIWNKQADELTDKWYMGNNTNVAQNTTPIITNTPQAVTSSTITPATNTGTSGSKTPGFLSKLWGGIKNAGRGLDLGNITQLANAYSIAAQRDARAEGLRAPKSFVANPYEQDSLLQLNKLRSDYYPVWALNREIEGRGKAAIAQSGGLSAGQRMLGYMSLVNQTQLNNVNAMFEHQNRENALRAQAANAALLAGVQTAARQQQAYQWDEDMLAKAHAARENMLETSAYDRQNALTQFFKNAWEKNQFDRTMNLYETDQKMSEADREFFRNQFIKNNKPAAPAAPTLADKAASTVTAAGAASIHPGQVAPTPAVPTIKVQAPQPTVKPTTKRGKKAAAGVKKPVAKGKSTTTSKPTGSPYVNAPIVETSASYVPYKFDNSAITDRYPNASSEAKLARPNKEKAGRPAPTSNAEALSRLWEKVKLGKREYERRYGKGS